MKYAGVVAATGKVGGAAPACCRGRGRALLVGPGGRAHAAVDVAAGE